ncbi:hypothetical protein GCM10009122_23320 [Fulvivirga kasyanovii]|uniref:Uncharacterized protein n=1 Tax=Fulvivirga kasyanovii TaxID=396812 RepID=A0ABW9RYZ5_9BACT|nr:hypothetical protein [Fulvivirga kasyanovii]MTI28962.1 hypothetical protein [Fulvivirga kasyanovii]
MSWFRIIVLIELLIIVSLSAWICRPEDDLPELAELREDRQVLQQEIDSLLQVNKGYDQEIRKLNDQADSLRAQAVQNQQQVQQLKTNRNENIAAIDTYDHHELVTFFANLEFETEGGLH